MEDDDRVSLSPQKNKKKAVHHQPSENDINNNATNIKESFLPFRQITGTREVGNGRWNLDELNSFLIVIVLGLHLERHAVD